MSIDLRERESERKVRLGQVNQARGPSAAARLAEINAHCQKSVLTTSSPLSLSLSLSLSAVTSEDWILRERETVWVGLC